jgi:hypothetical protein
MPTPYSNCMDRDSIKTEFANELRNLGLKYTRLNCIAICQQNLTIKNFGCYDLRLPALYNATPCLHLYSRWFAKDDCVPQCPYECESVSYDLKLSNSDFPSAHYHMLSLNDPFYRSIFTANSNGLFNSTEDLLHSTVDLARNIMVKIFIYFDEIKTTEISETPTMTFENMLANIGGTLGLFIGVSLLSFVELIELLFEIIFVLTNKCGNKK